MPGFDLLGPYLLLFSCLNIEHVMSKHNYSPHCTPRGRMAKARPVLFLRWQKPGLTRASSSGTASMWVFVIGIMKVFVIGTISYNCLVKAFVFGIFSILSTNNLYLSLYQTECKPGTIWNSPWNHQHQKHFLEYFIFGSKVCFIQHNGGVKSLKIRQQRDGTESVIWNLARFSNMFQRLKSYLALI